MYSFLTINIVNNENNSLLSKKKIYLSITCYNSKRIKTVHNNGSKFKSPVLIHFFTKYVSRPIINLDQCVFRFL